MFDELANRVSNEYELFLMALAGHYHSQIAAGIEQSPRLKSDMKAVGYRLGTTFYEFAKREFNTYLDPMTMDASGELSGPLQDRLRLVTGQVRASVVTNIRTVTDRIGSKGQNVTDLLTNSGGAMGLLAQRQVSKINFELFDTSGRRWNAVKLVRTQVRDFAYQSYLDVEIDKIKRAGGQKVRVVHPDQDHENSGKVFTLDELLSIRHQIFHPNSKATVEQA